MIEGERSGGKCREGKRSEYDRIYSSVCVNTLRHRDVKIVYTFDCAVAIGEKIIRVHLDIAC